MKIAYFLILAALPGAERLERRAAPKSNSTWLVETENSFLVEQYYMYVGAKIGLDSFQHIWLKILENRS